MIAVDRWPLACGAMAASALASWRAIAYARRRRMLDLPGPRRNHACATPRGGGIAPVAVIVLAGVCVARAHHDPALASCAAALAAVAAIGWVDDHRPLAAGWRLLVHVAAAIGAWIALVGVPHTVAACGVAMLGVFVIAGLTNAWNFMDGIDGLATSQAAGVLALPLLAGWLAGGWQLWCMLAVAALIGFFPYNAPRARIFLGDVGSGALGFLVAVVLLRVTMTGSLAFPLVLLPISAFVIDAGLTLAMRMARGRRWWHPHREHLYQWLVRRRRPHATVAMAYAGWTVLASLIAAAIDTQPPAVRWAVTFGVLSSGALTWIGLRRRIWIVHRAIR